MELEGLAASALVYVPIWALVVYSQVRQGNRDLDITLTSSHRVCWHLGIGRYVAARDDRKL